MLIIKISNYETEIEELKTQVQGMKNKYLKEVTEEGKIQINENLKKIN
jgi:regulator of replication initiation timing